MNSSFLEDLPEEVGAPVDDLRLLRETVGAVHEANQFDHALDLVEVSQLLLERRQQLEAHVLGRRSALFDAQILADLAGDEVARRGLGQVAGSEQQVAGPGHRHVAALRGSSLRKHVSELGQTRLGVNRAAGKEEGTTGGKHGDSWRRRQPFFRFRFSGQRDLAEILIFA